MKRPLASRADLLRALATNEPTVTAAMAELLGYEHEPTLLVLREEGSSAVQQEGDSHPRTAELIEPTAIYQPTPVPFWRLETGEDIAPLESSSRLDPTTRRDGRWRGRPTTRPNFVPLASKQAVLTELRKVPATRRTTREINTDEAVDRISQGRLLTQFPYRQRRVWGSSIVIIRDRSRRLTPYWEDQDQIVSILNTFYPPSGITIARIGDGDSHPIIRWPIEYRGRTIAPLPGTLVLVLGDLGCLAHQDEHLQHLWWQFGQSLRDQQIPIVALMPMKVTDVPVKLARTWTLASWGAVARTTAARSSQAQAAALEQLLTLLAPAVRIEPGLLRAVRNVFPEGRTDPGLEAQLWQHPAISSQHSVAASWDAKRREAYLEQFAHQEKGCRQSALDVIRDWRAPLHQAVWFEEIEELDADSRGLVRKDDRDDAENFWTLIAEEQSQREHPDIGTEAWISRFADRWPDIGPANPQVKLALRRLYACVLPKNVEVQVPGWYAPVAPSDSQQPVRRVALYQTADQLLVKTIETESDIPIMRGSPLGILHTANGEVKIAVGEPPPKKTDFWHNKRLPTWAQDYGWDDFGAWAMFRVGEVEQRMRWIQPGSFVMGSPKDEEGRVEREGPQHEVQLTRGFWLFDMPCTQALWQAVMGDNPSRFKGVDRPVEQVSWEDCQVFITRLNQQLPDLDLRLPSEAQWEYACRAGTTTARYEDDLDAIAWYRENSNNQTHPVKQKRPNAWGLYDMLGNVDEWCHDGLREYTTKRQVDPLGPTTAGADRAFRGGRWYWGARYVRSAVRDGLLPGLRDDGLGFRCASSSEYQLGQARPAGRVAQRRAEPAESAPRWPSARLVNLNVQSSVALDIPQDSSFYISTDRERLCFGQVTLPECTWAVEMGRDAYGLWGEFEVKKVRQRMRWIAPGRFLMGSPEDEEGRVDNEGPRHEVQLTHGFWLFDTPCTQELWQVVMKKNPSQFKGPMHPVENVSWEDCQKFLAKLNAQLPGLALSLPTEAEWEYACRAGTDTPRYAEDLDAIAWYEKNSDNRTQEVKLKQPNAWGLYDMLGNVLEWCYDGLREYKAEVMTDPLGPTTAGASRAIRGGSWRWSAQGVRSADRGDDHPGDRYGGLGFRCASSGQASRYVSRSEAVGARGREVGDRVPRRRSSKRGEPRT